MGFQAMCPECGSIHYNCEVALQVQVICDKAGEVVDYFGSDYFDASLAATRVSGRRCRCCDHVWDDFGVPPGLLAEKPLVVPSCCEDSEEGFLAEQQLLVEVPVNGETGALVQGGKLPPVLKEFSPVMVQCSECGEEV